MNYVPEEHALRVGQQAKASGNRHRQLARALAIGAISVLVLLVAFGTFSHYRRAAAAAVMEARKTLVPAVRTLVVQEDLQPRTIDLPGSMASTARRSMPGPPAILASATSISAARFTRGMSSP